MIDPTSRLSINRQARVLGISRGSVYYQPRPISDAGLKLIPTAIRIDPHEPIPSSRLI
jgi:putative transposase